MFLLPTVIFLQQLVSVFSQCNETFLQQPGTGPLVVAPIGKQVQLTCSVTKNNSIIWRIYLTDRSVTINTETQSVLDALKERGIVVLQLSETVSTLLMNGTERNNQSVATCVAINQADVFKRCSSRDVRVTYFGIPSAPNGLEASNNGIGVLIISWSTSTIEGVTVNFTLNATNIDDSNIGSTVVSGIKQQSYTLTVENPSPCDVYSFQVTAVNDAGASKPSEIITRSFPSLPDISPAEDSLHHSLAKTTEALTLNIMFNESSSCPDYPITHYNLVLENSIGVKTTLRINTSDIGIPRVINLTENSQYFYQVTVTNEIGTVQSKPIEIVTTDVQSVTANREENNTFSIQCSYITGSDALGCVYTLVSKIEKINNITGIINRTSLGVLIDIPDAGCYEIILAYDWESDNTTGTLPIRGVINYDGPCKIGLSKGNSSRLSIGGIAGIVLCLLIFVITALVISVILYRKCIIGDRRQRKKKTINQSEIHIQSIGTNETNLQVNNEIPQYASLSNKSSRRQREVSFTSTQEEIPHNLEQSSYSQLSNNGLASSIEGYSQLNQVTVNGTSKNTTMEAPPDYQVLEDGKVVYDEVEYSEMPEEFYDKVETEIYAEIGSCNAVS